jgi:hypothetical protein
VNGAVVYWQEYQGGGWGDWHGPYYSGCTGWICFQWPHPGTFRILTEGCWLEDEQEWFPNCYQTVTLGDEEYAERKCTVCDCLPLPYTYSELPEWP